MFDLAFWSIQSLKPVPSVPSEYSVADRMSSERIRAYVTEEDADDVLPAGLGALCAVGTLAALLVCVATAATVAAPAPSLLSRLERGSGCLALVCRE